MVVIIETPALPINMRAIHEGMRCGGAAPMAAARPGSHSRTSAGSPSVVNPDKLQHMGPLSDAAKLPDKVSQKDLESGLMECG